MKFIRELQEMANSQKQYQEYVLDGDAVFKVSTPEGLEQFVVDSGYGNIESFIEKTGVEPEEIYNVGWFELIHDRIFPADYLNK